MTGLAERIANVIVNSDRGDTCYDDARAILLAIREPTGAMQRAGERALLGEIPFPEVSTTEASATWRAMIDEALNEGAVRS